MVDGAMDAGAWQAYLEVHQLLVPCAYTLRLSASEEPLPPRRVPASRAGQSRGSTWRRGELHLHSEHSDGKQAVSTIADALAAAGLDFFALTDHNTTSGLHDLPAGGLTALPGCELTTFYGHATCLGAREFVPWYDGTRLRPFAQIAAGVRAQGGLVCVAHPFGPPQPLCAGCRWEFPGFRWTEVDLLEVWNGDWDEHASINRAALALWDRLLAAGLRLPAVAGSDMHDIDHLRRKRYARTLVRATASGPQGLLAALRAGRAILSSGPTVTLEAIVAGRRYEIGEAAVVPPAGEVALRGAVEDVPSAARVELVIGGRRLSVAHRWECTVRPEASTAVRAEVYSGPTLLALTNPVFIDVPQEDAR